MRPQFSLVRDATRAFGVPCIEKLGYEADDLIATYARLAHEAGARVTIVSSDKDLMQLVNDTIDMLDTMKLKTIAREQVIEKFGVPPEKVVDVQALAGDSTDNVPGVPGIGIKTAAQLIGEYGDLETLLSRASEIRQNKRRENLIEFADQARLSRRLVELDNNVPVEERLEEMGVCDPDPDVLIGFFKDMEFTTLTRRASRHCRRRRRAGKRKGKGKANREPHGARRRAGCARERHRCRFRECKLRRRYRAPRSRYMDRARL